MPKARLLEPIGKQGDAKAQYVLGVMYRDGQGVTQNYKKAVEWFRLAADQGHTWARTNLALMYREGTGVGVDFEEAARLLRLAAEQGDDLAQSGLGVAYANGEGVAKDTEQAIMWFRLAADQGNLKAQHSLGVIYVNGDGVPVNHDEAMKWFRLAAEKGYSPAQFDVGVMYANAKGVAFDLKEAFKWFRRAADQGNANAQLEMGVMYFKGEVVAQDNVEAVRCYRLAAEQGLARAQFYLGIMHRHVEGIQDHKEAMKWFRKAAEQGDANGQHNLGVMYVNGEGVAKDNVQAFMWIELAAARGHADALNDREALTTRMKVQEQTIAREAARKCKASNFSQCGPPPTEVGTKPNEPLLRIPAALLAQELLAYKTTVANIKMQIEAGATASFVNVAGKDWQVTKENIDAFLKEMQSSIDALRRAVEQRGYPQIAGRYSLVAGSKCKGDDFDVSGAFSTVDTNGQRILLKELTVRQAGADIEIMITGQNETGQPQEYALPAVLVENALIVGNLGNEPFNLWGTLKGRRIEVRFDEQQLKTAYGADSGSEANWAQVRDCLVSMTPVAP